MENKYRYKSALHDFQVARQRAALEEVIAIITGRSNELLSYEDVARRLRLNARSEGGIRTIPVNAIVGSVGRYTEFTRTFLPRKAYDQERWARVKSIFMDMDRIGTQPIEVYKVGDVYFVLDGNHRVSIARQEGVEFIDAHVVDIKTNVPISPDIRPDELIIKSEYAEFLEVTRVNELRPNVDLSVTTPGQYKKLIEWYDKVYSPLADAIRDRGLMRWFSSRTITDMYVWISEHRDSLEKELGWVISPIAAVSDLAVKESSQAERHENQSGSWRESKLMDRYTENLFNDILIPLSGKADSWQALKQACLIGIREGSILYGQHVVHSKELVNSPGVIDVQFNFNQMCAESRLSGNLTVEVGEIPRKICERAILTDLVVLKVSHPPGSGLAVLNSPVRSIISKSSRPVLAVTGNSTEMDRALLAYDGSSKAKEALFIATYLAERWETHLTVLTFQQGEKIKHDIQGYVHSYLDLHEIEADFIYQTGSINDIDDVIKTERINLVLMGGYSGSAVIEMVIGSTLDYMLRKLSVPILICR
jgi:nucleotide-binding universal stress UspA family protein